MPFYNLNNWSRRGTKSPRFRHGRKKERSSTCLENFLPTNVWTWIRFYLGKFCGRTRGQENKTKDTTMQVWRDQPVREEKGGSIGASAWPAPALRGPASLSGCESFVLKNRTFQTLFLTFQKDRNDKGNCCFIFHFYEHGNIN